MVKDNHTFFIALKSLHLFYQTKLHLRMSKEKPTIIFWIISIIALLWNAMGVNAYLQQAYNTTSFRDMYPDETVLEMVLNTPAWVMAAFATAVFGGVLGSIFLLLRKKIALPIFVVSLIGIVAQMFYTVFMSKASEIYGPGFIIMPMMVLSFGIFLVWYSQKAINKNWLV